MSDESTVDGRPGGTAAAHDEIWTVPNLISMVRIALIGVFVVTLVTERDAWAITALLAAGVSDFLDGYLARRWNQVTRLGRILDPTADRLLTIAVVVGLAAREVIPWWLTGALLARDVMVGIALLIARSRGIESSQVTFVGKAATFGLYVSLPLTYIAVLADWPVVWTIAFVGALAAGVLYWVSGVGYVADLATRGRRPVPPKAASGLG